jgi:hypothetical protein
MNATASFAERTMVAVDYFINSAMSRAWASVCSKRLRPPSEYGGGDICSLEETTSMQDDQPLE